jgi:prophage maintenance system killer protein
MGSIFLRTIIVAAIKYLSINGNYLTVTATTRIIRSMKNVKFWQWI